MEMPYLACRRKVDSGRCGKTQISNFRIAAKTMISDQINVFCLLNVTMRTIFLPAIRPA